MADAPRVRFCSCVDPVTNERSPSCLRCGRRKRPPPPPKPAITYHCARCTGEIPPGASMGMLYLVDHGVVTSDLVRFCGSCAPKIMELAVRP